ncbi:MAG TPA: MarR family winged helix-turn-helix transcriptional regulator [Gaiellaceae bacterium]|nr:MarR family winged helix-turn-helix transcriptional regulator [Gaiellaceae bacterium]
MPSRAETKITVLLELAVANAFVSELFDRECVRRGLRPAQVGMLILVDRHGPVTPTALEQASGWAGTTQRERLQELVEDGYIRRVPNPADRRSHFVETTPKGHTFLEATAPAIVAVEDELSRRLGVPIESYREPLERLHACAKEALAELSAPAGQRA